MIMHLEDKSYVLLGMFECRCQIKCRGSIDEHTTVGGGGGGAFPRTTVRVLISVRSLLHFVLFALFIGGVQ